MKATFGSGCFWCTEAIFQRTKGVEKVISGYSGGDKKDANYTAVCSGTTAHAEVIQLTFDPSIISYKELLEVFWKTHDPTTLNRQGNDVGPQYRSVIFYHDNEQKELAEKYKEALDKEKIFDQPIVTEISALKTFYPAEKYHQNYFNQNAYKNPYCSYVVLPKVQKFENIFSKKLK